MWSQSWIWSLWKLNHHTWTPLEGIEAANSLDSDLQSCWRRNPKLPPFGAGSLDDSCGDIDILIGSDYSWNLVSGETIRGDSGQTAVSSMFAWLLSGPLRDSLTEGSISSNLIISGVSLCCSQRCRIGKHRRQIRENWIHWNTKWRVRYLLICERICECQTQWTAIQSWTSV